jgi:hypothetical protein
VSENIKKSSFHLFKTESALFHDAVKLFATAVRELDATEEITPSRTSCKHPSQWADGLRIVNYMKVVGVQPFFFSFQNLKTMNAICLKKINHTVALFLSNFKLNI